MYGPFHHVRVSPTPGLICDNLYSQVLRFPKFYTNTIWILHVTKICVVSFNQIPLPKPRCSATSKVPFVLPTPTFQVEQPREVSLEVAGSRGQEEGGS
jgi:hypothetical protein